MGVALISSRNPKLAVDFLVFRSSFCFLFHGVPESQDYIVGLLIGHGQPSASCSLRFDQLWLSVKFSICLKKEFL